LAQPSTKTLLIRKGWHLCVVDHYDVENKEQREKAVQEQIRYGKASIDVAPAEVEPEVDEDGFIAQESEDEEKTEKKVMKERVYGERRSAREKKQAKAHGFQINTAQIKFS